MRIVKKINVILKERTQAMIKMTDELADVLVIGTFITHLDVYIEKLKDCQGATKNNTLNTEIEELLEHSKKSRSILMKWFNAHVEF